MRFDKLNASIANNAQEPPSLYMALCMMESLIRDVVSAIPGDHISQAPLGEDDVVNKLLLISNTINKIYTHNSDELTRNRARLDTAMGKLQAHTGALEQEMAQLGDVERQLAQAREKQQSLQRQVAQAKQDKLDFEDVDAQCRKLEQELSDLRQFDPGTAEGKIRALREDIDALSGQKQALETQLADASSQIGKLDRELATLREENAQKQKTLSRRTADKTALEQELALCRQNVADQDGALQRLKQEKEDLEDTLVRKTGKVQTLKTENETYHAQQIAPLSTRLAELEEQKKDLQNQYLEADRQCKALDKERRDLVLKISDVDADSKNIAGRLGKLRADLEEKNQEKLHQEHSRNKVIDELGRLQEETAALEKEMPGITQKRDAERQRQESLQKEKDDSTAETARLETENQKLEEALVTIRQKLKAARGNYDANIAAFTANTKEVEDLERKVAELRSATSEEQLARYKRQLADTAANLIHIQTECDTLDKQYQLKQAELRKLEGAKKEHDDSLRTLNELLKKLEYVSKRDYYQQTQDAGRRLDLLSKVQSELRRSVADLREALEESPFECGGDLDDFLRQTVDCLKNRTDNLCTALNRCVNTLRLEER